MLGLLDVMKPKPIMEQQTFQASYRSTVATFRLEYEDDYKYEFSVLSMRFRFGGRKFSKCACSELETRTRSRPRTPI